MQQQRDSLHQRELPRLERVRAYVRAHPALFAAQGSVVATWRTDAGRRLGPYFQLAWRQSGRQHWLYLGRSNGLAERVRQLLATLQAPRRHRRLIERLNAQVRASLRRSKLELKALLAPLGIQLKGFEFRGVRRALPRFAEVCANLWPDRATQNRRQRHAVGSAQTIGRGDPPERAMGRSAGAPKPEKRRLVNQTPLARFAAVGPKPARHPTLVGSWRQATSWHPPSQSDMLTPVRPRASPIRACETSRPVIHVAVTRIPHP
jgi:hypothetical protein